jgi:hypothetical protein
MMHQPLARISDGLAYRSPFTLPCQQLRSHRGLVLLRSPDGLAPPPWLGGTVDRSLLAALIAQK